MANTSQLLSFESSSTASTINDESRYSEISLIEEEANKQRARIVSELNISSLANILNAAPAPYGIVQLARRCGLNQDQMNLLFLHRSGGGNPAAAFVEALRFYHIDKKILKEICENEGLVHVAGFFQNFDLTRKFRELTPDDMSKLATLLLQQESWKIVAEGLEMQSLIQQFAVVAVMQNNSYCPTRYLLQLLAASRLYTVGELLRDLRAIGNVRAYNHLIEHNFSVTR